MCLLILIKAHQLPCRLDRIRIFYISPPRPVVDCEYNEVSVSPDLTGYVQVRHVQYYSRLTVSPAQQCLGPGVPSTHVFSLPESRCLVTLDSNSHIHHQLAVSSMPRLTELSLPLPSSPGAVARVKLSLPPVLREDEDFSFPLLVNM